ncbi:MAG: DUF885 family protein [Pseudomonadota bacterium]
MPHGLPVSARIAALLLGGICALFACSGDPAEPSRQVEAQTGALFATLAAMEISAEPETLTGLGLPTTLLGPETSALIGDRSQAAFERLRLQRIEALKLLESMALAPSGSRLRGHQEMVLRTYDRAVRVGEFGHGRVELGNAYPFVIDHRSGAWIDLPALLTQRQRIASPADADAFLARITRLASAVEDERLRLLADAEAGVLPPRFILDRLSDQIAAMIDRPVVEDPIILAFEDQVTGLTDEASQTQRDLRQDAVERMTSQVRPAYRRLAASVETLKLMSSDVPGVWTLPGGDAYYDAALALHTRAETSAENLHREARARVDSLTQELARALDDWEAAEAARAMQEAGPGPEPAGAPALPVSDSAAEEAAELGDEVRPPTVAERLAALSAQPGQRFADSDEGRRALAAALQEAVDRAREGLEPWIALQPGLPVTVRLARGDAPMPTAAAYAAPRPDLSEPGLLLLDASDLGRWPRYALPALALHEAVPGHHTEASFAMAVADLPLIRQLMWNTGYGEGWATYAERLGAEASVFGGDPLGEIGILQSQLFSAARQVVDTGIHRMRWERREAIDYLVQTTGLPEAALEAEVDRIVVWPGQAAAYLAGADQISALRVRAEAVLGERFDAAAFHYTLLAGGPRPLEHVEADMERWYEAQMVP